MAWLTGYRPSERKPRDCLASIGLASALCCYKWFLKLTM